MDTKVTSFVFVTNLCPTTICLALLDDPEIDAIYNPVSSNHYVSIP